MNATGQHEHDATAGRSSRRIREHRPRSDFVERQPAKRLSEAVELLVEQWPDRLDRLIAPSDSRSAGEYDGVGVTVCDGIADDLRNRFTVVAHDEAP